MVADTIFEPQDEEIDESQEQSTPKLKRARFPKLDKLVELQREAEKRILNGCEDKDAASLMRAWRDLEMLRRIMLNKPIQVLPVQGKLPKPRKFGLLRSIDAKQVIDVQEEKAANSAPEATVPDAEKAQ